VVGQTPVDSLLGNHSVFHCNFIRLSPPAPNFSFCAQNYFAAFVDSFDFKFFSRNASPLAAIKDRDGYCRGCPSIPCYLCNRSTLSSLAILKSSGLKSASQMLCNHPGYPVTKRDDQYTVDGEKDDSKVYSADRLRNMNE